jgi:hypothetical protein
MDRLIAERDGASRGRVQAHLVSVFGGDQEIAAVTAAINETSAFDVYGPGVPRTTVTLGEDAQVIKGSISLPGRKRPLRHVVALSRDLAMTRAGGDPKARRTVLCGATPELVLYRLGVRFGLPVLPDWSAWFHAELLRKKAIEPLIGLGCEPILAVGTKRRFLAWLGWGLKTGQIWIADGVTVPQWNVQSGFDLPAEHPPQPV